MLEKTRWYLRKWFFYSYRYLKHPRRLKNSPLLRWFARYFLDKHVWRPTQSTFAGGMAIGTFITIQLIPGQLPLGVLVAAIFRVNIPTVVVLCWLSNPFTFVPIGMAEKQFGDWLLSQFDNPTDFLLERIRNPEIAKGARIAQSMYLGGIVGGLLLMPIIYLVSWFSWSGVARLLRIPKKSRAQETSAADASESP